MYIVATTLGLRCDFAIIDLSHMLTRSSWNAMSNHCPQRHGGDQILRGDIQGTCNLEGRAQLATCRNQTRNWDFHGFSLARDIVMDISIAFALDVKVYCLRHVHLNLCMCQLEALIFAKLIFVIVAYGVVAYRWWKHWKFSLALWCVGEKGLEKNIIIKDCCIRASKW